MVFHHYLWPHAQRAKFAKKVHKPPLRVNVINFELDGTNVWSIKIRTVNKLSLWLYYDFCCKSSFHIANFACQDLYNDTLILSKNIHKVTKTDYVWFEFLWIRRWSPFVLRTLLRESRIFSKLWYFLFWFVLKVPRDSSNCLLKMNGL